MMTEKQYRDFRRVAREFFEGLENHLNRELPGYPNVAEQLARVVRGARASTDKRGKAFPEGAFLNESVFPRVYDFVAKWPGMSKETARRAFLCEGYMHNRKIASGSPARRVAHPFQKVPCDPNTIMDHWKKRGLKSVLGGRFPDMALREPFPYKTVFECKYFDGRHFDKGEPALVKGVYEAFYYLGLPRLPKGSWGNAWDYDFACFLAFDASNEGGLKEAWESVRKAVKSIIWDGANIYVMILRGSG